MLQRRPKQPLKKPQLNVKERMKKSPSLRRELRSWNSKTQVIQKKLKRLKRELQSWKHSLQKRKKDLQVVTKIKSNCSRDTA